MNDTPSSFRVPITPPPCERFRLRRIRPLPRHLLCAPALFRKRARVALEHSLPRLGLTPGDEVLFPAYHCGNELDVLLTYGLNVVFYPLDESLTVTASILRRLCSKRTRALYVVHYFGWPTDTRPLQSFCDEYGLMMIEDCAQSLYTTNGRTWVGESARLAIYSLYKFLPVPDGGLAVLHDLPATRAHSRRSSLTRATHREGILGAAALAHIRANDASMSSATFRTLLTTDHRHVIDARRANYTALSQAFNALAGARPLFPALPEGAVPLLFPLLVDTPQPLLDAFVDAGVDAFRIWSSVHHRLDIDTFPAVAYLKNHLVAVPLHQDVSTDDLALIASACQRTAY